MTERGEEQVIDSSAVGTIDLSEATIEAPESVPEVEEVADEVEIPTGKLEGALKEKFITLYNLIAPLGNIIDHSAMSRRIHFKVDKTDKHGKTGLALLFYSKTPTLWINYMDDLGDGKAKRRLEKYIITIKSIMDANGQTISQKELVSAVKAFKKIKGI